MYEGLQSSLRQDIVDYQNPRMKSKFLCIKGKVGIWHVNEFGREVSWSWWDLT